uniref:Argonaute 4 n=1 Tax=Kalanchoe fedtschenkoi TaxID=63787 RepID=A0A7N0RIH9_KALFE
MPFQGSVLDIRPVLLLQHLMEKVSLCEAGGVPSLPSSEAKLAQKTDLKQNVTLPDASVSPKVKIQQVETPKYSVMKRPGFGNCGEPMTMLSNHFKASISSPDVVFYQYTVLILSEDKLAIKNKELARRIFHEMYQTYSLELKQKEMAYDGDTSLYTVGPLSQNSYEFVVFLEETTARRRVESAVSGVSPSRTAKKSKHSFRSQTFTVQIIFAAKVPLSPVFASLEGLEAKGIHDVLRVLDVVLRQKASNKGALLVRQSYFQNNVTDLADIGGGVTACRGFHTSFRTTMDGLSLNADVSTTLIVTPGPVTDFLLMNQNVREPRNIDWERAKKILKNLRVKTTHNNMEFKITGISDKPCNQLVFPLKVKTGSNANEIETVETTVSDYYLKHHNIQLTYSAYLPCLNVGKKKPSYLPLEICTIVSLQRYTKALSITQRASLVERSRLKPSDRKMLIDTAVVNNQYEDDQMLSVSGIKIQKQMNKVDGRVLGAPKLKVGNNEDCIPQNGRWSMRNKAFLSPARIELWAVVNFSAPCDTSHISRELINCGIKKGVHIERPHTLIEEDQLSKRCSSIVRVDRMIEKIIGKLPRAPQFLLCVLPEKKNCELYGPWKKQCLCKLGIVTQCISPTKITDQYLNNVLLKINAKLGGISSLLAVEYSSSIPFIGGTPTMIIGMDVSHGSPRRPDAPSIAAIVGSLSWPLISKYKASVRAQSPKVEMIESLYKPLEDGTDDGMIRELLVDFYRSSNHCKPKQIIIFRDGVNESQFNQVLNIELDQIIKAYQHLGEVDLPRFTVLVAQKKHHTKLFQASGSGYDNVPPGTVVDKGIVHPKNYDFYLCAQSGVIGTSRPAHYHVLMDEIGFQPDDLQNFVHSLSYVYRRSTAACSVVAPICYAHHAAAQVGQFIDTLDTYPQPESASEEPAAFPELPRLHAKVDCSMFFC